MHPSAAIAELMRDLGMATAIVAGAFVIVCVVIAVVRTRAAKRRLTERGPAPDEAVPRGVAMARRISTARQMIEMLPGLVLLAAGVVVFLRYLRAPREAAALWGWSAGFGLGGLVWLVFKTVGIRCRKRAIHCPKCAKHILFYRGDEGRALRCGGCGALFRTKGKRTKPAAWCSGPAHHALAVGGVLAVLLPLGLLARPQLPRRTGGRRERVARTPKPVVSPPRPGTTSPPRPKPPPKPKPDVGRLMRAQLAKIASGDAFWSDMAAQTLARLGSENRGRFDELVPELLPLLAHQTVRVRAAAASVLWRTQATKQARAALPALIEGTRDDDPAVRRHCTKAIAHVACWTPQAIQRLRQLLRDDEVLVRREAAFAFRAMGTHAAACLQELSEAVRDQDTQVADHALACLKALVGTQDSVRADPAVAKAMIDSLGRERLRGEALATLLLMPPDMPVPVDVLVELLSRGQFDVRRRAAMLLGRLRPKAEAAVPAIERAAAEDKSRDVRDAARKALEQLRR